MNDTRVTFTSGDREIVLIGTAHVSRESIEEVAAAIREGSPPPDMVCVELDQGRYDSISKKENWDKLDVTKILKEGKGFLLMANLVLAGFQRRLGQGLGVKPGEEMLTALETAKELGINYALCDREIQITLRRAWARCGLWNKSKLMVSLVSSAFTTEKLSGEEIENLKNRSELDGMMNELAQYLPPVKETLIDERDRYLAAKIWTSGGRRVLAVVGAGHMAGIKTHLEKMASGEESSGVEELVQIPKPGVFSRIAPWLLPAVIVFFIGLGIYNLAAGRSGAEAIFSALKTWVLLNGTLAALGTIAALGHPLSVLVSFVGAPIATLNPAIGVGLLSALTEAALRKPRVQDISSINEAVTSLKGIYRNRITKALLVFLLSSLGGVAGNVLSVLAAAGRIF
ncbi:MAG: TraB/GumN family protein [Treponema sp.]|jgi:pheromone shutdown-related protein TraB|nr:TraB/GumN family protein [Treponema sp.]